MKKLFLPLFLLFFGISATAQKNYFIYIQSENGQPFYVKLNDRTWSSTAAGYLILSRMQDSTYTLKLGFPQDRSPEQQYTVPILRRDHGYLLKNFGEKGWGLYDLQNLSVQMSATAAVRPSSSGKSSTRTVSRFAEILSMASDDPSLREAVVRVKVPEKIKAPATETVTEKKKDPITEVVAKKEEAKPVVEKNTDVAVQKEEKKETVIPIEEKKKEPAPELVNKQEEATPVAEKNKDVAVQVAGKKDDALKPIEEKKSEPAKEIIAKNADTKPVVEKNEDVAVQNIEKKEEAVKPVDEKKKETAPEVVAKKEEVKPAPEKTTVIAVNNPERKEDAVKENTIPVQEKVTAPSTVAYQKSVVTKKSESSTTQGLGIVFIDAQSDGSKDTVNIIIPNREPLVSVKKEEPKEEKKFLEISSEAPASVNEKNESKARKETPVLPAVKNECRATAGKTDFYKLRKDMAGAKSDEGMLNLAKRHFRQKCFSVEQLKSLGALFLTDEARYNFFDIAYKHTSDPEFYPSLQEELKEAYYINRFKAMLRN